MTHQQAHELDRRLSELALRYQSEQPPVGALARLQARLADRSRALDDRELEWLAAAGPGYTPPNNEPR
jgi:hypothetical protein